VSAGFLDAAARDAFARAITAIEAGSAAEVVVAVRRRAASYPHANAIIGGVVAFAALAAMLFGDHVFALTSILIDPFVAGGAAAGLVELVPAAKRLLAPRAMRARAVMQAARAAFVERGVHNTEERSGLLVYVAWLERQVVLIPDSGLARQLTGDVLPRSERALTEALRGGGAAVADALAQLAPMLAAAMARRPDDRNELPDAIDSDLGRRHRGPRS